MVTGSPCYFQGGDSGRADPGLPAEQKRAHIGRVASSFGGNAASYFRAVNTSKFAAKLIIDGNQVNHNSHNMRSIIQFEGKDTYDTCKRYYNPFIPVMAQLEADDIQWRKPTTR
jgi:hypothetical protein